jgi:hypothetical protein
MSCVAIWGMGKDCQGNQLKKWGNSDDEFFAGEIRVFVSVPFCNTFR